MEGGYSTHKYVQHMYLTNLHKQNVANEMDNIFCVNLHGKINRKNKKSNTNPFLY